jgi:pimeloyl-ACP methyl ester carboxylesterase
VFVLTVSCTGDFPDAFLERKLSFMAPEFDQPVPRNLLLLPGLMCDGAFWAPWLSALPSGLAGRVVDYGDAESITAMAEAALIAAPPQFALASHSMGGRVALEVVRLAPERVQKLILMDTGYLALASGEKGEAEKAGRMALMAVARGEGVRAMCQQWVKGMVHPARVNDAVLVDSIIDMFARKSADRFERQQHALLDRPDATQVLESLTMPTLMLCGRQDAWAGVAQHEAMQALAPQSQLSVIEDAGHMVLMERPLPTLAALNKFLQTSRETPC